MLSLEFGSIRGAAYPKNGGYRVRRGGARAEEGLGGHTWVILVHRHQYSFLNRGKGVLTIDLLSPLSLCSESSRRLRGDMMTRSRLMGRLSNRAFWTLTRLLLDARTRTGWDRKHRGCVCIREAQSSDASLIPGHHATVGFSRRAWYCWHMPSIRSRRNLTRRDQATGVLRRWQRLSR
jgi:hypothetical protein